MLYSVLGIFRRTFRSKCCTFTIPESLVVGNLSSNCTGGSIAEFFCRNSHSLPFIAKFPPKKIYFVLFRFLSFLNGLQVNVLTQAYR